MDLFEVLERIRELLRTKGRLSYRLLQAQFELDAAALDGLKDELIEAERVARDENGKVLVWVGDGPTPPQSASTSSQPAPSQSPSAYTPQHLAERIRAEQQAMESRGSADGERKTITALFADLKGSTALIEGLDPEDARAIIDPALQLMMDAVHRYDGYVAQALGDGIFALFGAPIAHEDHPQRALYAALRMQEEMRGYADTLREQGRPPLLMRVGLNTGQVVVRSIRKDDLHADYVPVGHSTNLAARMEQLAAPGSILVSEHTHKLTDGYFAFKDMGKTQIKGVDEPLNVYEVFGAGPLRTRLQVSARRGLTRFVGRHSEMGQLQQALEQAKAGHGQVVGVMGEPGLGKSRLFYEFKLTSQSGCLVLEAFAVSHGKASPYQPLIELLKDYFQIEPQDEERTRRQKVIGQVLELDRSLEETLPYLFAVLGIEDPDSILHQMDPQIRRQRTFEALKKLFLRESLNQPLILIFEDLHWIDTETQRFLDTFVESVASTQVLLLMNYRPEYRHEWGQKTYYTQLRLAPLGTEEAEELLTFLVGTDASLHSLKPLILERTEGTPFFMEEVVQELVERGVLVRTDVGAVLCDRPAEGAHVGASLQIPPTVQGILAARIDRLTAEEKELLQQLSVIGRQFPIRLMKQVVSQPEAELYRILSSLQAKEFLYEQPAFPESEYLFKHALTQDVAYGTVLQEQRKALHERTGHVMEALYKDSLEDHYSELAHHYSRSENTEKAVEYLHLAGQQAVQQSAYTEAADHFSHALEFLQRQPQIPGRVNQELRLLIDLATSQLATKGYMSPEVQDAYSRGLELCQYVEETPELFPALHGIYRYYFLGAEFTTGRQVGARLLRLAQTTQDTGMLIEAHRALATPAFHLGDFTGARDHLEQAITLYNPQQHRSHASTYLYDPGVFCLSFVTLSLWCLGYPDQARQRSQQSLTLAQEVAHPISHGFALCYAAWLHQLRGERQATQERADALQILCSEYAIVQWNEWGELLQGWASVAPSENIERVIQQMREGAYGVVGLPYWLGLLIEVYRETSRIAEGLSTVAEIFEIVGKTDERFWEAELYRLKGELMRKKSQVESRRPVLSGVEGSQVEEEAEVCFRKAIDIAKQQEAKSLELRAAMSLALLWQEQGKREEARELLAPVYNWFTEGFDTADLKDAKALLEELA